MIKYAIPVILLICMTAYEASAANAALKCDYQFKSHKSTKAPKKPWILEEQFKRLMLKLDIPTYPAYSDFDRGKILTTARRLFGEGARVPRDPRGTYRMTWSEIMGRTAPKINWISTENLAALLRKLGIAKVTKFKRLGEKRVNEEAEKMFGEGARVPRDPVLTYKRNWPSLISGKSREEQRELTYQESLSLDLPEFIEKYLSKTIITKLAFHNEEIEELFHNFQEGMDLFNKKKFRTAIPALSKANHLVGNSKLQDIVDDAQFALDKHTEEHNKSSGHQDDTEEMNESSDHKNKSSGHQDDEVNEVDEYYEAA